MSEEVTNLPILSDSDLRACYPEVEAFAVRMRAELLANSGKGDQDGWRTMSLREAWGEIAWHNAKMASAIKAKDWPLVRELAADVANGAMMLDDLVRISLGEPQPMLRAVALERSTTETREAQAYAIIRMADIWASGARATMRQEEIRKYAHELRPVVSDVAEDAPKPDDAPSLLTIAIRFLQKPKSTRDQIIRQLGLVPVHDDAVNLGKVREAGKADRLAEALGLPAPDPARYGVTPTPDPEPQFDGSDDFYQRHHQWSLRNDRGYGVSPKAGA